MQMRNWFSGFLAAVVLAVASAAGAQSNEVSKVVLFDAGVSAAARTAAIERAGGRVVRLLNLVDGVEAVFPAVRLASLSGGVGTTLAKGRGGIASVELNEKRHWLVQAMPAFSAFPAVGDFLRRGAAPAPVIGAAGPKAEAGVPWGVARVNAQGAWGRTMGGGVKVAVIDTGIDATHPALKANYKGGFNAVTEGGDAKDDHGHGTHVAGTIGAASKEVVGVAPQASLYAIKVLDANGDGTVAGIVKGLEWAVTNRMAVVNMSLGGPSSEALEKAIQKTLAAGVVIVAAAGNDPDAEVSAPARYDGVIAVSASTSENGLAEFSTTGPQVDFIAPGHKVPSTWPGGGTRSLSGTSMATPHVTGLAVLAVALGHKGPAAVQKALTGAAVKMDGLSAEQQGAGMIDASRL